ncbi:MAG TPA: hypothetical protein VHC69_06780 [Polyangiaceae bacterium]|nr:hypothetical protein [Polyangiaceae bacterium]
MIDARALLVAQLHAIESDPALAERVRAVLGRDGAPMYYRRSSSPIELRAWDRAVQEIPTFRVGRELLVRASDLHAWIERHHAKPVEVVANDDDADEFDDFRNRLQRRIG